MPAELDGREQATTDDREPATGADTTNPGETTNAENSDVNGDGLVSPIDVLLIINTLELGEFYVAGKEYLSRRDVNADGTVSPLDALYVINHLETQIAMAAPVAPLAVGLPRSQEGDDVPAATIRRSELTSKIGAIEYASINVRQRATENMWRRSTRAQTSTQARDNLFAHLTDDEGLLVDDPLNPS